MAVIETERLVIRPWREGDAALVGPIYQDAEATTFTGGVRTDTELAAFVPQQIAREAEGQRILQPVVEKATQDIVGVCGLQRLAGGAVTEIGWKLARTQWGKGFAHEAARAVLDHGHSLGLERIVAVIHPRNRRSIAVANRLYLRYVRIVRVYKQDLMCYESVR
jgi:RimJ/RimL family protein N-acetyltransferase